MAMEKTIVSPILPRIHFYRNVWCIYALFSVTLIIGCIESISADCPALCECKWKSGKESVLCLNANLSGIPTKLDAGTQILDLTRNDISTISNDAFSRANLLNLQKLFLTKCRLKAIERYAFRKLINLVELDLSDNSLSMIPSHAFEMIAELRELKLIGNPIQRIFNDAFVSVPQLIRLELSNCRIGTIDVRAFVGLETSLEWLKLDGNQLVDIRAAALVSLQNLHGLELAGNPWNCSCSLQPLREWMIRENIPYNIPPMCKYPDRLFTKTWDKIDLDEFACVPSILASDVRAYGVEGKNITMSCMVGGVPEPNVRWMVRNRVIANLSGNTKLPATQGRKLYMVNLQQNASNLTILTAEIQDAGTYICAAENKAGRVEASVTLAISRKPPDTIFSPKVILAGVIAFVFFVVVVALTVICLVTLKRRKKIGRWNTQGRSDSYEKIELSNKPNYNVCKSPRGDRTTFMKSYAENGISVVGQQVRRNGGYRNVPSEDDGTDCFEDNADGNNVAISNIKIENVHSWNVTATIGGATKPTTTTSSSAAAASKTTTTTTSTSRSAKSDFSQNQKADGINMKPLKLTENDLHIPRLIEFSDSTPDSSIDFYDVPKRSGNTNYSTSNKSNLPWSHHLVNRKRLPSNANNLDSMYGKSEKHSYQNNKDGRITENDCDNDKKYPDLLDISGSLSMQKASLAQATTTTSSSSSSSIAQHQHQHHQYTKGGHSDKSTTNNPFCTLPRKKHNNFIRKPISSESQSPLLNETSSQYGSSTFTSDGGGCSGGDLLGRRLSNESFSNYPLSFYTARSNQSGNGRSNSFLNLTTQPSSGKVASTMSYLNPKRNPSLPSSPEKDPLKFFSAGETPLLDFSSLGMHKQQMIVTPSSSTTSTAQSNAYDYHAAQLERFLEEYRNLQEQLCKMKETCDSIRKKEAPLRGTAGNSVKVADPVMFSAATLGNSNASGSLTFGDGTSTNPKGILKNKVFLPNQPPDPPPYWLHRNAMLKRLQDPNNDFFHS